MHKVNLSVLFLNVTLPVAIFIAVAALVVGGLVGWLIYKAISEKKVGSTKAQVNKIIGDAEAEAERIKAQGKEESKRALKEALLEAKEHDLKLRNEFERETK